MIERLANWLDDMGFDTEIKPLPGAPTKANLIATYGAGDGGIVLAGHTDTVPFDDSVALAADSKIELRSVSGGGHRLLELVDRGELADTIRALSASARRERDE